MRKEKHFSQNKNDIGDVKDFKLDLNVTDKVLVAEAYRRIPRQLYNEVKNHVNNLIVNGWVQQSFSHYSSPMVCKEKRRRIMFMLRLPKMK